MAGGMKPSMSTGQRDQSGALSNPSSLGEESVGIDDFAKVERLH